MRGLLKHKLWTVCSCSILISLAFYILPQGLSSAETVSIKGKVTFADAGIPEVATITLGGNNFSKQVISDREGNYVFYNIPLGIYTILVHGTSREKSGTFVKTDIKIGTDTSTPLVIDIVIKPIQ